MQDFIEIAKKQGFTTVLLLVIAWLLYNKLEAVETRIRDCEAEKFQIIAKMVETSNMVIERNSRALDHNAETMQSIQAYLGLGTSKNRKTPITAMTAREGIK